MKKLLLLLFLVCVVDASAQDVIVKKDGSTVVCRVIKLTDTEIVYELWSDQKGDNYIMDRSLAATINYQNGKKDILGDINNKYQPGNQNDGVQQFNDRALLAMDAKVTAMPPKGKQLQRIGLIGGGVIAAVGGIIMFTASDSNYERDMIIGGAVIGIGVIGGVWCYLKANTIKKQSQRYQSSVIYEHEFKYSNGTLLSAGMDMISDCSTGMRTVGFGLRYTF